jgi:hypothetical protein
MPLVPGKLSISTTIQKQTYQKNGVDKNGENGNVEREIRAQIR